VVILHLRFTDIFICVCQQDSHGSPADMGPKNKPNDDIITFSSKVKCVR